jgi:hypothetical protein
MYLPISSTVTCVTVVSLLIVNSSSLELTFALSFKGPATNPAHFFFTKISYIYMGSKRINSKCQINITNRKRKKKGQAFLLRWSVEVISCDIEQR